MKAKKAVAKKSVKKQVKRAERVSVASLIRQALKRDPKAVFEAILKEVKALDPKSRFDRRQFSWYKCQVKRMSKGKSR